MSNFLESKKTRVALWIIGAMVFVLLAFGTGTLVGYQRGIFSTHFGQEYYRNFYGSGGPAPAGMVILGGPPPMNQHGTVGVVIDVGSSTIATQDLDGDEESVVVATDTVIRDMNRTVTIGDIAVGDGITVIGEPNNHGQIYARFIRIFSGSSTLPQMPPPQGQ